MTQSRRPSLPPVDSDYADRSVSSMQGREPISIPRVELFVEREAGKPAQRSVVLNGDNFLIGAHKRNDLQVSDPLVSRFHCRLTRAQDVWRVTDAGSRNGTVIAGIRVRDADLTPPECRVVIGATVIRVQELPPTYAAQIPIAPVFGELCGFSRLMRQLFDRIERVGRSESDVLVEGETGTGKGLIAREIARCSKRADKPFVVFDCSATPPSLLESELFGHASSADAAGAGAFEAANRGILVINEIGELPVELQPRLLQAIADREVCRAGESAKRKVDVRVIALTSRALPREVNQKRFQSDLYMRISTVTLRAPPLRDRVEDIPILVQSFASALGLESEGAARFPPDALEALARYDWPGNVRELKRHVERRLV